MSLQEVLEELISLIEGLKDLADRLQSAVSDGGSSFANTGDAMPIE